MWWAIPVAIVGFTACVIFPIAAECYAEKKRLEKVKKEEDHND